MQYPSFTSTASLHFAFFLTLKNKKSRLAVYMKMESHLNMVFGS